MQALLVVRLPLLSALDATVESWDKLPRRFGLAAPAIALGRYLFVC
jgi:hypothetical protein